MLCYVMLCYIVAPSQTSQLCTCRTLAMLLGDGGARSDSPAALNVRACAVARVVEGSSALVLHCRVPGAAGERLSTFLTKLVGS